MRKFVFLFLILCSSLAAAQTPDGETPANEGVCDELIGATPGLYGLCVAFCEAQDCQADFSASHPFAGCTPSGARLAELYNKRKQASDPDLPCIKSECPCFSQEEVDAIPVPYFECRIDGGSPTHSRIIDSSFDYIAQTTLDSFTLPRCAYAVFNPDGTFISRIQNITAEEQQMCREIIVNTIDANISQCMTLDDNR